MRRCAQCMQLLLALLLLVPLSFAPEPLTDANFPAYIYPHVVSPGIVEVKVLYLNLTYYEKLKEQNLPQSPDDFFKPGDYAENEFTASTAPLAFAPIYFTFNDNNITSDSCSPKSTDATGTVRCNVTSFRDPVSGSSTTLDDFASCGSLRVEFRGMYAGAEYFQPSSAAITYCSAKSAALSALGTGIYNLRNNPVYLAVCFPLLLIMGLLIASMYYSGRDPLSLFDLTTPRLPKVKSYRVKAATAPQMMRSITRRYIMMQHQAEKSVLSLAQMAAAAKAQEQGLKGIERRRYIKKEMAELKERMRKYTNELKRAKAVPSNERMSEMIGDINSVFDRLKPDRMEGRLYNRWKYSREMISGFLETYNFSKQASDLTSDARGGKGGGPIKRGLDKVLGKVTEWNVKFDDSKAVRFISRIPVVSVIVTGPTKTFDAFMQFRATRRGTKTMRRNLWGGAIYQALLSRKDKEDPGERQLTALGRGLKAVMEKTPIGTAVTKWNGWTFNDFEKRAKLMNRKAADIFNYVENARKGSAYSLNDWYRFFANMLIGGLPLVSNAGMVQEAIEADLERLRGIHARAVRSNNTALAREIKAQIARVSAIAKSLPAASDKSDLAAKARNEVVAELAKSGMRLENTRYLFKNSRALQAKLDNIGERTATGNLTLAAALQEMITLADNARNMHNNRLVSAAEIKAMRSVVAKFAAQEKTVQSMLVYRDSRTGAYIAPELADIEALRNGLLKENIKGEAMEKAFVKTYGTVGKALSDIALLNTAAERKVAYEAAMRDTRNRLLANPNMVMESLLRISERANEAMGRVSASKSDDWKKIEADFQKRLLRMNMYGNFPTALYMQQRLLDMVPDAELAERIKKIKNLDDFELLYRRGAGPEMQKFWKLLEDSIKAGKFGKDLQRDFLMAGSDAQRASLRDAAAGRFVAGSAMFAHRWEAGLWNTTDALSSDKGARGRALGDFLSATAMAKVREKINPHERREVALKRSEFNKSYYTKELEANLLLARAYDQMAGFVSWKNMSQASWGENSLGKASWLIRDAQVQMGTIRKMYENLTNKDSKYYDAKFERENTGKGYEFDTFMALINRGRTFADMRRGMPFIIAGDMRGGIPLLEFDQRILEKQGKPLDGIVRSDKANNGKADIRDIMPLMARISESRYINLPTGIVALSRYQTPGGEVSWLYGDPRKNPQVSSYMSIAEGNPRLREQLGLGLAGMIYDEKTKSFIYEPGKQMVRIVSTQDFHLNAKKGDEFFGVMTGADKFREKYWRATRWAVGQKASDMFYAGIADRTDKMHQWFTSQLQVRFALDALAKHTVYDKQADKHYQSTDQGFMVEGRKRHLVTDDSKSQVLGSVQKQLGISDEAMGKVSKKIGELQKGDNTFLGNWNAGWYNFKREVAAKTVIDISKAEDSLYTARLGLKAVERLYRNGEISATDYQKLRSDFSQQVSDNKLDYKEARKDFKEFNNLMIGWVGSHERAGYGSEKNPFTMWKVFNKYLDSRWVQGTRMDYWWMTESSAMRDPRAAIGAGFGLDFSFYVGYQTGQNVYERSSFWGTNAMWERRMETKILPTLGIHKWWNDYISYAARRGSAYPSFFEQDHMTPGQHGSRDKAAWFKAPFQSHYHTDYFQSRAQSFIDYSGMGTLIGTYLDTGSQDPHKRNTFKKMLDWAFIPSSHYNEKALWRGLQRPLDQFEHFEKRLNSMRDENGVAYYDEQKKKDVTYQEAYNTWYTAPEGSEEKRKVWNRAFKDVVQIYDHRPLGVQEAHSGRDLQEDGSRNRFMELYAGFHSNVWKPGMPALVDIDPITNKYRTFPQSAAQLNREPEGTKLKSLATFSLARYDKENERMEVEDKFYTSSDAYRDVYKKSETAAFHFLKLQSEMMAYSMFRTPTTFMFDPYVGGAAYLGMKALSKIAPKWTAAQLPARDLGTDQIHGGGAVPYEDWTQRATGFSLSELSGGAGGPRASYLARKSYQMKEYFRNAQESNLPDWWGPVSEQRKAKLASSDRQKENLL